MTWEEDDLAIYLGTSDGFVFYYKLQDPSVRLQVLATPGFCVRSLACIFNAKDQKLGVINERAVYIGGNFNSSVTEQNKCIYEVKIAPKTVIIVLLSNRNKEKVLRNNRQNTMYQLLIKYLPTRMYQG